jgi:hypothetical protein
VPDIGISSLSLSVGDQGYRILLPHRAIAGPCHFPAAGPFFRRLEPLAHSHIVSAPQLPKEFIRTMESTALALLVGVAAAVVAVMVLAGNWLEQRARRRWSQLEGKAKDGPLD